MKSVLILGATGMLGYGVCSTFINYKNIKIVATVRTKKKLLKIKKKSPYNKISNFIIIDVLKNNEEKIRNLTKGFDYIINCIGIIKPEINLKNPKSLKNAIHVNSFFPKTLSKFAPSNSKILQIATDCVYSGKRGKYHENSYHDDVELYGVTKSFGEIKKKNFYNLRTSIIGKELYSQKSLIEWFLKNKNENLKGFENHFWNGVTTKVFGEILYTLIINDIKIPNSLHIIPKDVVNKYQLLQIFKEKFKGNCIIEKFKTKNPIDRSLKTNYQKNLNQIWKLSKFKKKLSVKEMVYLI